MSTLMHSSLPHLILNFRMKQFMHGIECVFLFRSFIFGFTVNVAQFLLYIYIYYDVWLTHELSHLSDLKWLWITGL